MLKELRSNWSNAEQYQRFLYCVGALLVSSAVFHAAILLISGGPVQGDISWRKPILFGESFGLTCISIAWIMNFIPKRRGFGWLLCGTLGFANFGEVLWVSVQQWRGVPSHFNIGTTFDAAAFGLAGALILLTEGVTLTVAVLSFGPLRTNRSTAWAIRIGLALLIVSQVFGNFMIGNGSSTFGAAGSLKVPHALALHGLQLLPILAWACQFVDWSERRRTGIVILGSVGYAFLVTFSAAQAFRGHALFDVDSTTGMLGATGVAILVVTLAQAISHAIVGPIKG